MTYGNSKGKWRTALLRAPWCRGNAGRLGARVVGLSPHWDLVVPRLAEVFRVLTYDRRGHSQSERPTGQGSVREDVADLAALLEHLGLVPAWVVGNSFGASITLRLACEHAELFRGLIAHEPPLFSLLGNDPGLAPLFSDVQRKIRAVVERIASGDHTGATEQFVETVALGPGAWATIPPDIQQAMIENAPTFLDEANDRRRSLSSSSGSAFLETDLTHAWRPKPATFSAGGHQTLAGASSCGDCHIARGWPRSARNTSGCLCRGGHQVHA